MCGTMAISRHTRRAASPSRPPMSPLARVGWISVIVACSAFALRQLLLLFYTLGIIRW